MRVTVCFYTWICVLFLGVYSGPAQTSKGRTNAISVLPVLEDSVTIPTLISDPDKFLNRPVAVCGSLVVQNYYNYHYDNSANTHYSLSLLGLSTNLQPQGKLNVFASRAIAKAFFYKILYGNEQGGALKFAWVTIKITRDSFSYNQFNDCVELVDWQFLSEDHKSWQPWALSRVKTLTQEEKQAAKMRQEALQAKAKKDADEKALKQKSESAAAALRFHQQLADKGDPYGLFRMGQRYLTGDGVETNFAKAQTLLSQAASKGQSDAKALLERVGNKTQ